MTDQKGAFRDYSPWIALLSVLPLLALSVLLLAEIFSSGFNEPLGVATLFSSVLCLGWIFNAWILKHRLNRIYSIKSRNDAYVLAPLIAFTSGIGLYILFSFAPPQNLLQIFAAFGVFAAIGSVSFSSGQIIAVKHRMKKDLRTKPFSQLIVYFIFWFIIVCSAAVCVILTLLYGLGLVIAALVIWFAIYHHTTITETIIAEQIEPSQAQS